MNKRCCRIFGICRELGRRLVGVSAHRNAKSRRWNSPAALNSFYRSENYFFGLIRCSFSGFTVTVPLAHAFSRRLRGLERVGFFEAADKGASGSRSAMFAARACFGAVALGTVESVFFKSASISTQRRSSSGAKNEVE